MICPVCGGNLLPDTLHIAKLSCLLCSRRYNVAFDQLIAFDRQPNEQELADRRRWRPAFHKRALKF